MYLIFSQLCAQKALSDYRIFKICAKVTALTIKIKEL